MILFIVPEMTFKCHSRSSAISSFVRSLGFIQRSEKYATLLCPRPVGGAGALSDDQRPLSVCPSNVAYIGSNSKTKRPRKTKLGTEVPQVTCDSHTDFKIKRSKVKVTGRGHIVAAT